ncbi:MAG: smalltalk protein [Bacteroidaceae bacterium]|nr:smalltalk protein [Bacteroidaceae bacterium]
MNNNKNPVWGKLLQILITILTAIATTFGVQSCM